MSESGEETLVPEGMLEYRVTFGWGQPHGPSPEDSRGHWSTIWAPDSTTASGMAFRRYGGKWASLVHLESWKNWEPELTDVLYRGELECLQYDPEKVLPEWPTRDSRYPDCVYGRDLPRG